MLDYQAGGGSPPAGQAIAGEFRVSGDEILYRLGRLVVNLYARLMFEMNVTWEEPLPTGPKIIAPNHPSATDPFLIAALVAEPTGILILDETFKVPVFGRYLRLAGHVPVVRGNGRQAFERAKRLLGAGRNVAIFPEGEISPLEGGFHAPRSGAARLALSTGAPIVPVGIHLDRGRIRLVEARYGGTSTVGTWYLRGPYAMTVGEPVHFVGDVEDRACVQDISERIMRHITRLAHQSAQRVEKPCAPDPQLKADPLGILGQV